MNNSREMKVSGGACSLCSKEFANPKLRNRHIKRIHKLQVSCSRRNAIVCPICKEGYSDITTYDSLRSHLEEKHNIASEKATFNFSSAVEYDTWKQAAKIKTFYATDRKNKFLDYTETHYVCNRSNSRGYQAKHFHRIRKARESIKIHGVCPSKLLVRMFNSGKIFVSFWKTHAGHVEDELRCKHLSTRKKDNMKIQKLKCGQIETEQNEGLNQFIEEEITEQEFSQAELDNMTSIRTRRQEFSTWIDNLPDEDFVEFLKDTESARKQIDMKRKNDQ